MKSKPNPKAIKQGRGRRTSESTADAARPAASPAKTKTHNQKAAKTAKPMAAAKPVAVKLRKRSAKKPPMRKAKFSVGQVVRHRIYPFRGVVFDIDPIFNNTDEWWLSIPEEVRPRKDQPFYHLLAENDDTEYIAYVSEQNLIADTTGQPIRHPQLQEFFLENDDGTYRALYMSRH